MKQLLLSLAIILTSSITIQSQDKILQDGNAYLNSEQYAKAEKTFRKGIKKEPDNLIYQCQLGLTLIDQGNYEEAEGILNTVLDKDPDNIGAVWYSGIGNFKRGNDRKSISMFEKALTLLDPNSGQYYSSNWYIGKSYSILLKTEGLSYDEVDRMLECYEEYLRFQPNAKDALEIRDYVDDKKNRRASRNVELWIDR